MRSSLRLSRDLRVLHTTHPQPTLPRAASRLYSQLSSQPSRSTYLSPKGRIAIPSIGIRYNSNKSPSAPLTDQPSDPELDIEREAQNQRRREEEPAYQITFTCKPCGERSSHRMSKHGYHRGTVLIQCPGCENRHVISDNLGIFFDKDTNLEDLLEANKEKITRGELKGDMEFWDDGTMTRIPTNADVKKEDQ
ncbi:DNL zinc finger-domain-containing protein [Aspergillus spectabilis]